MGELHPLQPISLSLNPGRIHRHPGSPDNQRKLYPIPASERPPTCSASRTANCLPTGVLAEWNELYASLLGQWDYTSFFNSRDAKGNVVDSVTSPPSYDQTGEHFEFMASDTWQIKPSLTLSYGINLTYETPYRDINGKDYLLVDGSNNLIKPAELLNQKLQAANKGAVYNTTMYYVHPAQLGGRGNLSRIFHPGAAHRGGLESRSERTNPGLTAG